MLQESIQPEVETPYGPGILESLSIQPNGYIYARIRMSDGTWKNVGVMQMDSFLSNSEGIKKA
jgi:hypothetical protein